MALSLACLVYSSPIYTPSKFGSDSEYQSGMAEESVASTFDLRGGDRFASFSSPRTEAEIGMHRKLDTSFGLEHEKLRMNSVNTETTELSAYGVRVVEDTSKLIPERPFAEKTPSWCKVLQDNPRPRMQQKYTEDCGRGKFGAVCNDGKPRFFSQYNQVRAENILYRICAL